MNMEKVEMTQEELNAAIEIGEVIESAEGEKLKCVSKQDGVPLFERV